MSSLGATDQADSGGPSAPVSQHTASLIPPSGGSESRELGVWASPLAIDEDSSETFGFSSKQAKMRYERALQHCPHQVIGPIPVEEFLETFMDCSQVLGTWSWMPPSEAAFKDVPEAAEKESLIYKPLIESLNWYVEPKSGEARPRCPGFRFLNTADRGDRMHGDLGSHKPDICCYAEPHVEVVQSTLSDDDKDQNYGATVMGYTALFVEVKKDPFMDPFRDIPADEDRSRWKFVLNLQGVTAPKQDIMKQCFGQNVTYAAEILARQHRQFLFSILVCGTTARLVRWDRAGALVTTAFDIHHSPEHLCHFLWCFALVSDMRRGYDITVEMAHPHEHSFFESAIRRHLAFQAANGSTAEQIEAALKVHFLPDHVTAIRFPQSNSKEVKRLLISRPFVYPLAVFGRGTRAYWAVDVTAPLNSAHQVVLLKDTWREDPPSSTWKESEVIERLSSVGGVHGVPSVLFCGDVIQRDEVAKKYADHKFYMAIQDFQSYQSTQTQEFLTAPWICGAARQDHLFRVRLRKHTHHRLVLDTPGQTLVQFSGSHELLTATYDVLETLDGASTKYHVVHRTLSPRSIILYRQPTTPSRRQAYLVDWDQSWDEQKDMDHDCPFLPPWQFVCADLAIGAEPMERYSMVHDMESLLYVVLYLAVLCLKATTERGDDSAVTRVLDMFEIKSVDQGRPSSEAKQTNKARKGKRYTEGLVWQELPAVQTWMDTVFGILLAPADQWTYDNVKRSWKKIVDELSGTPEEHDRMQSLPPLNGQEDNVPRALTAEPNCPTMSSLGKRNLAEVYGGPTSIGSSVVKRLKTDLTLKTEGAVKGAYTGDPSGESTAFVGRSGKTSARRGGSRTSTNAKAGPSRLAGSHVGVGSPATASTSANSIQTGARIGRNPSLETYSIDCVERSEGRNAPPDGSASSSFPPPILAADFDFLFAGLSNPP